MLRFSKRTLENCGIFLLAVYFVFEGLQKLIDNVLEGNKFKINIHNLETTLNN